MIEDTVVKRVRRKPVIVISNGIPMWDGRATLKDMYLVADWLRLDLEFRVTDLKVRDEKANITEG